MSLRKTIEVITKLAKMSDARSPYPDISEIIARKKSGRRQRAALSFAEKLAVLDTLKERVAPIVRARKARRRAKVSANKK
jgi:hypothetical protein